MIGNALEGEAVMEDEVMGLSTNFCNAFLGLSQNKVEPCGCYTGQLGLPPVFPTTKEQCCVPQMACVRTVSGGESEGYLFHFFSTSFP